MTSSPAPTPASPNRRDTLELVEELAHLAPEARVERFAELSPEQQVAVFGQLDAGHQHELLDRLDEDALRPLVESLPPDDRVQLFELLPTSKVDALRDQLSPQEQAMTDELLRHPEESAGRMMSPEFLVLSPSMTAAEALALVREQGRDAETVFVLPVTDANHRLLGMTTLDELVFAQPDARVGDFMETDLPLVYAHEDQEAVARLMQSTDSVALPVVDDDHVLLGLVTIDDAMDVMDFEESEDLARTGGAEPLRRPYFAVSVYRLMRTRVVWLLLLAVAAMLTVNVLSAFQTTIEENVTLSLFIPLLIGVGGNAGAQSATTIVRAMAVDDVRFSDLLRVIFREARVGFLLGLTLAALSVLIVWPIFGQAMAIVIALSLVCNCTLASLVGALMPILASRFGVDPAVVSAPFVTTVVDSTGLLVYLLIATMVLGL